MSRSRFSSIVVGVVETPEIRALRSVTTKIEEQRCANKHEPTSPYWDQVFCSKCGTKFETVETPFQETAQFDEFYNTTTLHEIILELASEVTIIGRTVYSEDGDSTSYTEVHPDELQENRTEVIQEFAHLEIAIHPDDVKVYFVTQIH